MSGYVRLGIALSVLWIFVFSCIYFLGIYQFPVIADIAWPLYRWTVGTRVEVAPHSYFTPFYPATKWQGLAIGALVPIVIPWILLFVIPNTIRWVRAGFSADKVS